MERKERIAGPAELRPAGGRRLWFALGGPPLVWFAAQNAGYFFVSWACARAGGSLVLHAIAAVSIGACAFAGWVGYELLRDVGARGEDDHDDSLHRTRFLARLAIAGALIFALLLLVQWLAIGIIHPCDPMPRGRFSPDAFREAADLLAYAVTRVP